MLKALSSSQIAIVVIILVLIAGAAFYFASKGGETTTTTPTTTKTTVEETTTKTTTTETETTTTTTTTTETQTSPTQTTTTTFTTTTKTTTTTTTTTTQTKEPVTLIILTRHPGDILQKTKELFLSSDVAKQYNIVDIQFISVPPGLWPQTAKAKKADLGWGGGPTLFDTMFLEGLLAPLTEDVVLDAVSQIPETLAGVPLKRYGDDGKIYWVSAAVSSFGFTVNKDLAAQYGLPIPQSWRDLASVDMAKILVETLEPPLGIADPTASTSNTRMYEIILQAYGWDQGWRILTLMAANAHIYGGSGDVRDAVIRGERIVGITIDFYGYTAQLKNPSCVYINPPGETIVNGDPIALFNTGTHPVEAQAFIAWVLTEGQKVWLDPDINRLPANPKVFETPEGQARSDLQQSYEKLFNITSIQFNDTLALSYEFMMQQYFKATLVDQHSRLQEAWMKLVSAYLNGQISQDQFEALKTRLTDPVEFVNPLTGEKVTWSQDVAIELTQAFFSGNTSILDQLLKEWRDAAAEKYDEVITALGG